MDDHEDFLMRPIKAGYLPFLALRSTEYDLADFVFCNEAIDVDLENQYRVRKGK